MEGKEVEIPRPTTPGGIGGPGGHPQAGGPRNPPSSGGGGAPGGGFIKI